MVKLSLTFASQSFFFAKTFLRKIKSSLKDEPLENERATPTVALAFSAEAGSLMPRLGLKYRGMVFSAAQFLLPFGITLRYDKLYFRS